MSLKKVLENKLSEEELSKLRRSFEIIGDIVIVDIPDEILRVKDEIINGILLKHKHIKSILRKVGEVDGEFRIAKYEVIYGSETETIVKEHGARLLVDPTKVYYSVKLSGERERVVKLIQPGENVLVMFAGIGPYPILIARLSNPSNVIGIELNPEAIKYFKKNIRLNKVDEKVKVLEGDVKKILPELNEKFDRILMPAPNTAEEFVSSIRGKIKECGWVHYYTFAGVEEEKDGSLLLKVSNLFKENGMVVEVQNIRKCGHFAPYVYRYVLDLKVISVD